jgi:hypothetical protein
MFLLVVYSGYAQQYETKSILELESDLSAELEIPAQVNIISYSQLEESKKSVGLGILYSLLLPGMGELYADSYSSGKYFTIADGVLWGVFVGMNAYSNWQEDNYKSYAASQASINPEGKDSDYFTTIGEFSNIDVYNDEKALERNFDKMYDRERFFWKWETTEERKNYRDMWSASEQTNNDLRFVVGALILNRIVSAINAVRLVSAYNNNLEEQMSWNVSVGIMNQPNLPTSVALNFQTSF